MLRSGNVLVLLVLDPMGGEAASEDLTHDTGELRNRKGGDRARGIMPRPPAEASRATKNHEYVARRAMLGLRGGRRRGTMGVGATAVASPGSDDVEEDTDDAEDGEDG